MAFDFSGLGDDLEKPRKSSGFDFSGLGKPSPSRGLSKVPGPFGTGAALAVDTAKDVFDATVKELSGEARVKDPSRKSRGFDFSGLDEPNIFSVAGRAVPGPVGTGLRTLGASSYGDPLQKLGLKTLATTIQTSAVDVVGQGLQALDAITAEETYTKKIKEAFSMEPLRDTEIEQAIGGNPDRLGVFDRLGMSIQAGMETALYGPLGAATKLIAGDQAGMRAAGVAAGLGLETLGHAINVPGGLFPGPKATEVLGEWGRKLEEKGKRAIKILGPDAQRAAMHRLGQTDTFKDSMKALFDDPGEMFSDIVASAPQFLFQFGAASKGPMALSLMTALQEVGPAYKRGIENNLKPDQAISEAVQAATNQAFLARGGVALASKRFVTSGLLDWGMRTSLQVAWEIEGEQLNRFILNLPGQTLGEMIVAGGLEAFYGAPIDFYASNAQSIRERGVNIFGQKVRPSPFAYAGETDRGVYVNFRDYFSQLLQKKTWLDKAIGEKLGSAVNPETSPIPNNLNDLKVRRERQEEGGEQEQQATGRALEIAQGYASEFIDQVENFNSIDEAYDTIGQGITDTAIDEGLSSKQTESAHAEYDRLVKNYLSSKKGKDSTSPEVEEGFIFDDAEVFVVTSGEYNPERVRVGDVKVADGDVAVISNIYDQEYHWALRRREYLREERDAGRMTEEEFRRQDEAIEGQELKNLDALNHQRERIARMQQQVKALKDKFAPDVTLRVVDLGALKAEDALAILEGRTSKAFFDGKQAVIFIDGAEGGLWKVKPRSDGGKFKTMIEFDYENFRVQMADGLSKLIIREAYDKLPVTEVVNGKKVPGPRQKLRHRYIREIGRALSQPMSRLAARILPGPIYADFMRTMGDLDMLLGAALASRVPHVRKTAEMLTDYGNWLSFQTMRAMLHLPTGGKKKIKLDADFRRLFGPAWARLDQAYGRLTGKEIQKATGGRRGAKDFIRIAQLATEKVMSPKVSTFPVPKSDPMNSVWAQINPEALVEGQLTADDLAPLISDPRFLPEERRALKAALADQAVGRLEAEKLAEGFDTALQFEKATEKWFKSMNRFQRALTRMKPDQKPEWTPNEIHFGRTAFWLYTLEQIREVNPNNPYIREYVRSWQDRSMAKVAILEQGEDILADIKKNLTAGQEEILGKILIEQRLTERRLTPEQMRGRGAVTDTIRIVGRITDFFQTFVGKMEELELETVKDLTDERREQIRIKYEKMLEKPYFPLSRFGERAVAIRAQRQVRWRGKLYRKGQEMYFRMEESKKSAEASRQALHEELTRLGIRDAVRIASVRKKISPEAKLLEGMPVWVWQSMRDRVAKLHEVPESVLKEIDDLVAANAPENSFTKRFLSAKKTKGFSTDAVRSIASYVNSFANYYSRLKFEPGQKETIQNLNKAINKARRGLDVEPTKLRAFLGRNGLGWLARESKPERQLYKMQMLERYMTHHLRSQNSLASEWTTARQLGFFGFLALNAKSWFVNATQVPLVAFPYLSAQVGGNVAMRHINRAYKDLVRTKVEFNGVLSQVEADIILQLERAGVLNQSLYRELATVQNGGVMMAFMGTRANRTFQQWMHGVSGPFQWVESGNRWVTALAAIRSLQELHPELKVSDGRRDPVKEKALFEFARDTIDKTMFEYSKWNRSRIFQGKKGALFLFQSFLENMLFRVTRRDRASLRMLGMMFLAGGLQGMPGAEDIEDIIEAVWTKLAKEDINVRSMMREILDKNNLPGDFLMDGAGKYGLGLPALLRSLGAPVADVDLSGSLSYGRVIPFGLPETAKNMVTTGFSVSGSVSQSMEKTTGALGNLLFSFFRAMETDSEADWWRRVEMVMPKGIPQGFLTAVRWELEGKETTAKRGNKIIDFDVSNPEHFSEMLEKSLGFQPTRLSEEREIQRWKMERFLYYSTQRGYLMLAARDYRLKRIEGDKTNPVEWQKAVEKIRAWNKRMQKKGLFRFTINMHQINQSAKAKYYNIRLKEEGMISGDLRSAGEEFDVLDYRRDREKKPEEMVFISDL